MREVKPKFRTRCEENLDCGKISFWKDCGAALNKRYQHLSAESTQTGSGMRKMCNHEGRNVQGDK